MTTGGAVLFWVVTSRAVPVALEWTQWPHIADPHYKSVAQEEPGWNEGEHACVDQYGMARSQTSKSRTHLKQEHTARAHDTQNTQMTLRQNTEGKHIRGGQGRCATWKNMHAEDPGIGHGQKLAEGA